MVTEASEFFSATYDRQTGPLTVGWVCCDAVAFLNSACWTAVNRACARHILIVLCRQCHHARTRDPAWVVRCC